MNAPLRRMKTALTRKILGVISPFEIILFLSFLGMLSIYLRWQFAVAFAAGLLVHELGHVVAMRAYGMRIKGMYFVFPFGAIIVPIGTMPSRFSEAVIGLAGPAAGLLTALAAMATFVLTGEPAAIGVAGAFAFFNLFNLLPARPLDGGRAASALAFSASDAAGLAIQAAAVALCAYAGLRYVPILLLVAFFGWVEWKGELRRAYRAEDRARVTTALADAFGCAATPAAVLTVVRGYQTNVLALSDEQAIIAWMKMFRNDADPPLDANEARSELLATPSAIASSARKGRIPAFAMKPEFVTELSELQAFAPPVREEDSPLYAFLSEKEKPRMSLLTGIATFAAYAMIAALLWGIIALAFTMIDIEDFMRHVSRR